MPKPENASVVLWAPSDTAWSMLNGAGRAAVIVAVAVPVDETPAGSVILAVSVTTPLGPAVKATLLELAPTMSVPFVMLHA